MMTYDSDFDHSSILMKDCVNRSMFGTTDDNALQSNHCSQCIRTGDPVIDLVHVIMQSYQVLFMVIVFVFVLNDTLRLEDCACQEATTSMYDIDLA